MMFRKSRGVNVRVLAYATTEYDDNSNDNHCNYKVNIDYNIYNGGNDDNEMLMITTTATVITIIIMITSS